MTTQTKTKNLDRVLLGRRLLKLGFRVWFLYMFRLVNGTEFIEEKLHRRLFRRIQRIIDGKDTRLNINLCPRSGKTTINQWLCVYALTINPRSQIIYTSFNQDLLSQISQAITGIMTHPAYIAMYSNGADITETIEDVDPIDDFWREYLLNTTGKAKFSSRKIITAQGGIILFNSIGSAITGFGCFSYDTLVMTRQGKMKLGEIVEKKLDVDVLSFNFDAKRKEYSKIHKYIKNDESKYMQLILDNGEIIDCTPDHIFYTSKGELRADCIRVGSEVMTNLFNFPNWYIKLSGHIVSAVVFIKNKVNLLLGKRFFDIINGCFPAPLKPETLSDFTPNTPTFNVGHRRRTNAVFFGNLFVWSFIFGNLCGLIGGKFLEFSVGEKLVVCIILGCTIAQILNAIIYLYRIYVPGLLVRFSDKGQQYKPMDKKTFPDANGYDTVSFVRQPLFQKLIALGRKYLAMLRNKITIQFRYRKVVNIVYCNHKAPSYCLTLQDNNNLFVGESQILVHNCGVRNAKGFSGMLCIDDGDKPTEVRSEKIRSKTHTYFVETLLTRLNNSDTPITNTQQRLHQDDLSGFLEENYKFDTFKFPLLDEDGKCNLPRQYTDRRIKELQVDAYTFSAQYQQEPIMLGGGVIKHDWWRFYKDIEDVRYRRIFITADTANKTKEWNDYTAIGVWGLTTGNRLRLLDLVHGKLEIPELQATMLAIYEKWKQGIGTCRCTAIYIEDKASGTQVIQQLRRAGGLPILPFIPDKDKLTRVQDALPQIAAGNVELPESDKHPMSKLLIDEADAFSADMSHIHDDLVDMLTSAVSQAYNAKGYF